MVDEVKIVGQATDVNWAKDTTLERLIRLTDQQNDYLATIAGTKRTEIKSRREEENSAKKVTEANKKAAEAAEEAAEANEKLADKLSGLINAVDKDEKVKRLQSYRDQQHIKGVEDLRSKMSRLERATPAGAFETLTNSLTVFGGRLSDSESKFKGLGSTVQGLSKVMAAAAFTFGALAGITDPFRGMVDSGLLFEGSAVKFARAAYDSGLGLQEFTRIAGQYSQAVSAVGEQAYSESVKRFRDSSRQFGYFGMNATELADAQGRYMNMMRESGTLFYMTAEQQDSATTKYLTTLTALSVLQGKQRKTIEAEQEQAARRAQIQLTIEKVRREEGEEAANALELRYKESVTRVGQTAADVGFAQEMGLGGPTREEARRLGMTGMLEPAMALRLRGTEAEYQQSVTGFQQRAMSLPPEMLNQLALQSRFGTAGAAAAEETLNLLGRARPEQAGAGAPGRRAAAEAARQGRIIDRTTERTITAQVAGAEAINSLKSAALGAAEQLGILRAVAEAAAAGAQVASGAGGILSGMAGSLGGAATIAMGMLGANALKGMLMSSAVRTLMPTLATRFMAPLTPTISSLGGATTGAGILGSIGGLGRGLGIAGGALGTAGGIYAAGAADTQGGRTLGILGAALSGAATGAMLGAPTGIGVPIGALLGGLVGGGGALLNNIFATRPGGATPAATPGMGAGADLSAILTRDNGEMIRIMTMINLKLGEMNTRLNDTLEVRVKGTVTIE